MTKIIAFDGAAHAVAESAARLGLIPEPAMFATPERLLDGFTAVHADTPHVWRVEGEASGVLAGGTVRLLCQLTVGGVRVRYIELCAASVGQSPALAQLRELAGEAEPTAIILNDEEMGDADEL